MKLVDRTLDILEAVTSNQGEADLSDLARITGLQEITARRFASALVKRGYLFQKERGGKYSLGIKSLQLADTANAINNITENALPFLKILSDEILETVCLQMLDGVDVVYSAVIGQEHILQVNPNRTDKLPLHCTSAGKIFLAFMLESKMNNIISNFRLNAYTDNTITNIAQVKSELETARRDGIAFDDEEYISGIRSAAAPVRSEKGNVVASVVIVAPAPRMGRMEMRKLAPKLISCALEISRAIGYKGE